MRYIILLLLPITLLAAEPIKIELEAWSPGLAQLAVCDTPDQVASIVTAHNEGGSDAGGRRFSELSKEPGRGGRACGAVVAAFMVTRSLWVGEVEGKPSFIAEMLLIMPNGKPIETPVYGAFIDAVSVSKGEAKTSL